MIRVFLILILLLLNGCGYQLINKINNNDFKIIKFDLNGNNEINKILAENFIKFENTENFLKSLTIKSKSELTKRITSKDKSGNSSGYEIEITISISVSEGDNIYKDRTFNKNSNYNATGSQFELKQYEEILIKNMTSQIIFEINSFLKTI